MTAEFRVQAPFVPTGDQPRAIQQMVQSLRAGHPQQTLLGATGTGKTFVIANVIEQIGRSTLVLAHNKTLAAQLCNELREFFPDNAVEYFISYYDYYQPEAYIPVTDTYIAKSASINDEIDMLRHSATRSLFERRDVIVVASISCIYGLGIPSEYLNAAIRLEVGLLADQSQVLRALVSIQYERNDVELGRGKFRVRGDILEIGPAYEDRVIRVEFWGDEIEAIQFLDPVTGTVLERVESLNIYPARHFVTPQDQLEQACINIEQELETQLAYLESQNKLLEAQRLKQRTRYDLELLRTVGYCNGVENYSRHLAGRAPGSPSECLVDYFPEDWLLVVDESHVTVPQLRGMYEGDQSRKRVLIEHGFRLPSAADNRPLKAAEFWQKVKQCVFVSATPGEWELGISQQVVELIIRPTGVLDPEIDVRPTTNQVEDLTGEIHQRVQRGEKVLVTTLTKRMAEDLTSYFQEHHLRVNYLHSEIDAIGRIEILQGLRSNTCDVIVGVNLLREGLDLPEVSLVAILDADKEGFLRSERSLIQTIGRAARHIHGQAILYADLITESMERAIQETQRRRQKQMAYNQEHGITPQPIRRQAANRILQTLEFSRRVQAKETPGTYEASPIPASELPGLIQELEQQMQTAAQSLEFEQAAHYRDQIQKLKQQFTAPER
ncbi:excinuclease ABC subunit B [Gloeomargarita lithophora Alchichica-D10]|uniref:UvrABC system protein B n=1 Tax=Gloeomargarita lithophora Alchichica-D10 TaxID=1188229 RepID=A0A1J0A960_9CYAN|nr:excinuclease ABC subunit UvrB [Gloeomargarita lithophora]APB32467.1 excinuclease ABC subunit B [Gloeomargarita lithophora Alchichica-D10]